jgi:hypothetical protein
MKIILIRTTVAYKFFIGDDTGIGKKIITLSHNDGASGSVHDKMTHLSFTFTIAQVVV